MENVDLLNQRIDDMHRELKGDIHEIKELFQTYHINVEQRVSKLEHFKTRFLGIASGISLILGAIFGVTFL